VARRNEREGPPWDKWHGDKHSRDEVEGALENALTTADKAGVQSLAVPDTTADPAAVTFPISNPSADFLFSIMAGLTQSETSTAWCGNAKVDPGP
jgi:hypothetical protein